MFAIIKTGGKQYKVQKNSILKIEKIDQPKDTQIIFDEVLMIDNGSGNPNIGIPLLAGATVKAQVLDQIRDDKIIIFKKKRRHNYRRKKGHRQYLTVIKITDILLG